MTTKGVVTAYFTNDGKCFGCGADVDVDAATYLAHEVPGSADEAYPFCQACEGGAWPMHRVPTFNRKAVAGLFAALPSLDFL